ncbi:MAG TPA: LysR family transcriptional regulator [Erwinia persicina]|uniref:LysR family transcriptional regulator n=1 Tax=Erwinia persicina TaxID=55211 RepID=A0A3S7S3M9_9GAMM|nr:LysR family transcriptional regulator [Erwinia persicina]AXU95285.1 LysR family transcriptional regulator [Erwinia persicina]MBD8105214.1 LysR family transcriptional regulator [Erwinia persicina]MBD8208360.1 LysR family transcriptional regulator [Erwinia persicina]MCQ4092316.1 LysR family transcriptional regulator [Erwinia persicina]MCQ4099631.1 LysR family transcriptional regulator [Erwinia persicina]
MNIELRHLRYFVAVAEELHFGRAAQRLNISQPPLSQQIQNLEKETGARLLARTNRSVQLTAAGQQFLQDARHILQQVEQAADKASRLHRGDEGELRIGFTSSAPFITVVSDALFTFRQRFPAVHIQMQEINTRQQLAPLSEGRLDLGVMRNTLLPENLDHQLLLREPMYALVHRAHRLADRPGIALSELAQEPFVFFDPQVGTALYGEILALLGRYQIQPDIAQEVGEAMTIIGLVSTGLGVSILPASFRRVRLSDVVWIPLTEQDAQSEVWLVWSRQREMPAVVASMMKLLLPFPQQK